MCVVYTLGVRCVCISRCFDCQECQDYGHCILHSIALSYLQKKSSNLTFFYARGRSYNSKNLRTQICLIEKMTLTLRYGGSHIDKKLSKADSLGRRIRQCLINILNSLGE